MCLFDILIHYSNLNGYGNRCVAKSMQSSVASSARTHLLHLPVSILLIVLAEYLNSVEQISTFGCLCSAVCHGESFQVFWAALYHRVTRIPFQSTFNRSTRSQKHPRQAYFGFVRMSWVRQQSQVIRLLEKEDAPRKLRAILSPDTVSSDQLTGLMILACYTRRTRCVKTLITDFNVDYNAVSSGGTLLIVCAWSGDLAMVRWLISFSHSKGTPLRLDTKGTLMKTSACGGKGPFTAKEWARRKAATCSPGSAFERCAEALEEEERRQFAKATVE